jgi:TonB family protein
MVLLFFCLPAQDDGQKPAQPSPASAAASSSHDIPADSSTLEIIKAPTPDYPLEAAEGGMQGQVRITLHIAETGDVEGTEIVSGNPVLAKAAERAMKKWKFKPFIRNGKAIKVNATVPYDFAFKNNVFDTAAPPPPPVQPDSSSPASGKMPLLVRVSQGVMEGMLVHRVQPVYPPAAKRSHTQGEVLLRATIGKDGRIHNLTVVSGPRELIDASVGAVQQWRYRPYMIKGDPVDVETTIRIEYHM